MQLAFGLVEQRPVDVFNRRGFQIEKFDSCLHRFSDGCEKDQAQAFLAWQRRAFLRCPREYWLDHWARAEIFRCRTRASALSSPAASAQPFRPSLSAQGSRSSRAQPPVTHALGRSFQLDHRPSRSAEKQRDRRLFRRSGNARLKNYSRSCRRVSRASWLRHLVRNKTRAVLENR